MRWVSFFIGIMMVTSTVVVADTATTIRSAKNSLNDVSSEMEENRQMIQKKRQQREKARTTYGHLLRDLKYTELRLRRSRRKLSVARTKVSTTQKKLAVLEKEFNARKSQFSKRLVAVYKQKHLNVLGFIFSPNAYLAYQGGTYYVEQILKLDSSMIRELRSYQEDLLSEKRKLDLQTKHMVAIERSILRQESGLVTKKKRKHRQIRRLSSDIARFERRNKELEEASKRIAQIINSSGTDNKIYYGTGRYIKPVKGWLSSKFGRRLHPIYRRWIKHQGIDFAAPTGYRIRATDSGVVLVAGQRRRYRGYGKVTVVDHGIRKKDGKRVSSLYAHQSRILVKEGQFVKKGDVIGLVGSTGNSTGPHLHFEIRINGMPVNPLRYVKL